jgi:hypothetical protein
MNLIKKSPGSFMKEGSGRDEPEKDYFGGGGAMSRVSTTGLSFHFTGSGDETLITKYLAIVGSPILLKVNLPVIPT